MNLRILAIGLLVASVPATAQTFPEPDPILESIWRQGMDSSRVAALAQTLLDSIGPRLTGSPGIEAGNTWLVRMYGSWGVEARNEQYDTWMRWRRGITHLDLLEPRVRSLEATMLAWSPGTGGRPVRAGIVVLPDLPDAAAFATWLPAVRGRFVAVSFPEPSCRPADNWEEYATPTSLRRMQQRRASGRQAWRARIERTGYTSRTLPDALERAGALGILTSRWSNGWGVQKIFAARTERVPTVDVSCEDYGLLVRLAEHDQGPIIELTADAEALGEGPVFNTVAEIRGSELPNEYVMLSAHFDSWDGGSGATDNGTGTLTMLEAMRILSRVYPRPRRTIVVGHWSGEEQGLNGSRAFVRAHPEIVAGLQALFNQDNGTGRVVRISAQGLTGAGAHFADWLSRIPDEMTRQIQFIFPGTPSGGGSDNASFICAGAPAFSLGALGWSYGTYTWHTNRDTYDKIVFDDLRYNATLTAMLVYLASEDPERVPRDRRTALPERNGRPTTWPVCRAPRTWEAYRGR